MTNLYLCCFPHSLIHTKKIKEFYHVSVIINELFYTKSFLLKRNLIQSDNRYCLSVDHELGALLTSRL